MFESMLIRVIVAVIVIVLGIMLLKILKTNKKAKSTYAVSNKKMSRSEKKSALKSKQQQNIRVKKNVSWAPSPIDSTMTENGAWDTNRNPSSFVTNVSKNFPENSFTKDQLAWKSASVLAPTIPDVTMTREFGMMPLPPNGSEDPFVPEFGSVF